jgi:TolB-like protein/tetratricopeptide (TPR) repeat protein
MTDQLISTLGQIRSLQVTSLSSVLPFADRHASIQEIGRLLNVEHLVEATVTMDDADVGAKRVRINARLITAGTDGTIWSQSFERSLGDTLALQAEVARAIAGGIQATLTPAEQRRLQQTKPSTPEATQAYFQGLHYLSQSSSNGVPAVEAFTRATELDPNHAGAHAGLARGYITLGTLGLITHPEARVKALAETRRAIELDPESAEAYAVRADLQFYYDWDWSGADESYRRAIALNASFGRARSQYARYLAAARRGPESIAESARAADLDPMSASAASTKAMMLFYDRDYEGALTAIQHALQLEPGAASAYFVLSRIQASRNDLDAAIAANERALEITGPSAASSWRAHLIRLKALSGQTEDARKALRRLPTDLAARKQLIGQGQLAFIYEAMGDHASALSYLEKGINEREPDLLWLAVDPRADSLRSDPRFVQLLARLGAPR